MVKGHGLMLRKRSGKFKKLMLLGVFFAVNKKIVTLRRENEAPDQSWIALQRIPCNRGMPSAPRAERRKMIDGECWRL